MERNANADGTFDASTRDDQGIPYQPSAIKPEFII